MNISGEAHS